MLLVYVIRVCDVQIHRYLRHIEYDLAVGLITTTVAK